MPDFEERYRGLSDDELLQIAASGDELTPEAETAFLAEVERRNLLLEVQSLRAGTSGELEARDLVTIERFRDLIPAQLAQGALNSAGISAVLCDENMVRLDWLYSNLIGGIRLVVDRADKDAALEILNAPTPRTIDAGDGELFEHPACPNCQSTETFFEELDQKWSKASLFAVPLPIVRDEWHCESCGHYWKAPQE